LAPESILTLRSGEKSLVPAGIRAPAKQTVSLLLYRLQYVSNAIGDQFYRYLHFRIEGNFGNR
jgi:hypothetical protein